MAFRRVKSNRTLALARVNLLLGRVFSISAPIIGFQMAITGLSQNYVENFDQFWFWLNWILMAGSYLWMAISIWVVGDAIIAYRAMVITMFFAMATWSLQVGPEILQPGEQPWIWWGVGVAGVAAVGGFNLIVAGVILFALPATWFAVQISNIGGPVNLGIALQDSVYTFLASTVISGFVAVLRYESSKVDQANHLAGLAAIELAKSDAVVRERDRVDALVHDSVLTTLIVAANAQTAEREKEAELLAKVAIAKLAGAVSGLGKAETISINSLFTALEVAIRRQSDQVQVIAEGVTDFEIPGDVAAAVTESTLQALANSFQHAGKGAERTVILKGTRAGLKIVVKDTGKGFRPSRVPKNRLGLKLSIVGRMKSVNGRVFIDSKIGVGTNVIIEWGTK
jgi:signal transduction histidine kinase